VNMQGMSCEHVELEVGARRALLRMQGRRVARFAVARHDVLTRQGAEALRATRDDAAEPTLVVFKRSSPDARAVLREHGISYAAADGELFVLAPPVYVERPARRRGGAPESVATPSAPAAPFAARASRVPRRLLLQPVEQPTFRELARELELSEAMVSRTVRALADDGLVTIESDRDDARRRRVRLRDPGAVLDAFERAIAARRRRSVTWDVGARDVPAALALLHEAAVRVELPYAVGGLAGAALVRRVVEPADVALWVAREDVDAWTEALLAAPGRPGPGRLTVRLAPDPFVLTLASRRDGLLVADPVQLYLDCRLEGERALEAADAIRAEMPW
jgi:hypothetical protein